MSAEAVTVVIPAFNEEARLPASLGAVAAYFSARGEPYEIIVVDDGSNDATADVAREAGVRVVRNSVNQGKGNAVRRGVMAACGDSLLIIDADLSTPIEEYERLRVWLERGADLVIGSRGMPESQVVRRQPLCRDVAGRLFNQLTRLLLAGGYGDTQCGFKLISAAAARRIFPLMRVDGFAFDVEMLAVAEWQMLAIREVAVRWCDSPYTRVRLLRDGLRMTRDLVSIRLGVLAGVYGPRGKRCVLG